MAGYALSVGRRHQCRSAQFDLDRCTRLQLRRRHGLPDSGPGGLHRHLLAGQRRGVADLAAFNSCSRQPPRRQLRPTSSGPRSRAGSRTRASPPTPTRLPTSSSGAGLRRHADQHHPRSGRRRQIVEGGFITVPIPTVATRSRLRSASTRRSRRSRSTRPPRPTCRSTSSARRPPRPTSCRSPTSIPRPSWSTGWPSPTATIEEDPDTAHLLERHSGRHHHHQSPLGAEPGHRHRDDHDHRPDARQPRRCRTTPGRARPPSPSPAARHDSGHCRWPSRPPTGPSTDATFVLALRRQSSTRRRSPRCRPSTTSRSRCSVALQQYLPPQGFRQRIYSFNHPGKTIGPYLTSRGQNKGGASGINTLEQPGLRSQPLPRSEDLHLDAQGAQGGHS